jgi:hypothetical protein
VTVEDAARLAEGLPSGFDPVSKAEEFGWGMCNGKPGFVHAHMGTYDPAFSLWAACEEAVVAGIIRDIVGNPFRPPPCCCAAAGSLSLFGRR